MATPFETVQEIIKKRRTVKPNLFNGKTTPDEYIRQLLALADWAPTHGKTEPWRFVVYSGEKVQHFCATHAEMYRQNIDPEKFMQGTYDKLLHMGNLTSHVVVAYMQRGNLPKIPALEEVAATACAVQNMLLGAAALGIAAYWGSGGMTYSEAMKTYLGLRQEDQVLGLLYFGYTDQPMPAGKRLTPLSQKIRWA